MQDASAKKKKSSLRKWILTGLGCLVHIGTFGRWQIRAVGGLAPQ
jgi:hypothetical protein